LQESLEGRREKRGRNLSLVEHIAICYNKEALKASLYNISKVFINQIKVKLPHVRKKRKDNRTKHRKHSISFYFFRNGNLLSTHPDASRLRKLTGVL